MRTTTLATCLPDWEKRPRPRPSTAQSIALKQKLAQDNPAVTQFRSGLALGRMNLGELLSAPGKFTQAEAEYRAGIAIYQKLADDSPSAPEFRSRLAQTRIGLGRVLAQLGDPSAAEVQYRAAISLYQQLAEADPSVVDFRAGLVWALYNLGDAIRVLGRAAEARDVYARGIAIKERMAEENPAQDGHRRDLAALSRRRGLALIDIGELAPAAGDARRALELFAGISSPRGEEAFETACCHAALAGLAGRPGSSVPAADAPNHASAALALLQKSFDMGYRNGVEWKAEKALDALRGRGDFRLLRMDAAMPEDPLARPD